MVLKICYTNSQKAVIYNEKSTVLKASCRKLQTSRLNADRVNSCLLPPGLKPLDLSMENKEIFVPRDSRPRLLTSIFNQEGFIHGVILLPSYGVLLVAVILQAVSRRVACRRHTTSCLTACC